MKQVSSISELSYNPYSKRNEYCYVEGKSGILYPGVRVENISFPLSISAVQAAVCSCLANKDMPIAFYQPGNNSELLEYWVDEFNLEIRDVIPDQSKIYQPLHPFPHHPEEELESLCEQAVTIHSNFPVSALLYTDKGCVHGVNVEVGAWSLGLCAERVALSRAMAAGIRHFSHIHVAAPKSEFCSPCGACRQVLNELMPKSMIYLHHKKNSLTKHFVEHLLPNGFTSEALKNR